ncbi:MAG: membrane protein insertase YidC [Candidatus Symbiothrix sp.]|jgi:YidC/Oxa1 family membrane protein insertase|nr:membrane protein insertase YidC [Candidatus Symbiothrix sp.]
MDKNTIIGFILILAVILGFSYLNRPSKEQLAAQQRYLDSMEIVRRQQQETQAAQTALLQQQTQETTASATTPDSVIQNQLHEQYSSFAVAAQGTEESVTLSNNLMELTLSNKGGRISSVRLKNYTDYKNLPLCLFDASESSFEMIFITPNNRVLTTNDFYFEPIATDSMQLTMRLHAGDDRYMDFIYSLHPNDYMVNFDISMHNLESELSPLMHGLNIQWKQKLRQQEQGRTYEDNYAYLMYKFMADDVEHLNPRKDDIFETSNKLKWIGYKDQFFSAALIADNYFESTKLESRYLKNDADYLKEYYSSTTLPFQIAQTNDVKLHFYFGPNDYALLKGYDKTFFNGQNLELEKLVPLGWWVFRAVNKYIIIPIFDWLTSGNMGLGLAIFLLTLIIRIVLFPLTYKSLMSSAKMRALKPQIEAITAKYPGQDNAITRQQKTMEFYRQMGVSPMAGCLPMLLQMPFLIALFMFFPSAIQLRHESFLWANDLSTYDAIIHWNFDIPLISGFMGNHISIFCLLMSLVTILNTKFTMDQQNTGQEQMPGMKWMMYLMPVMMFFFLNSYPAGLNYYYLISTLITVAQTIGFRYFLNEKALLVKLEANKGKMKTKKKSGFMARLEEAQRQQQALLRERQKQQQKRR